MSNGIGYELVMERFCCVLNGVFIFKVNDVINVLIWR